MIFAAKGFIRARKKKAANVAYRPDLFLEEGFISLV
jgi:hypothetical protein